MSSVYEALQRARHGSGVVPLRAPTARDREPAEREPFGRDVDRSPVSLAPGPLAPTLMPLLAAIRPLLDSKAGIVLHVVAATLGEGASTIAREFAMLSGTTGHRRTLLVDADRRNLETARAFGCDTAQGLIEFLWGGLDDSDVLQPIAGTMLSVTSLVGERGPAAIDAESLRELYSRLREQFELIVVDCPAVGDGGYSNLLPEAVDGVVLVVQAEKTRPAVIAHAKDLVQQAGGQVLGAVLNRRTNYIPDFLYKLL
ncbi:MAG: CpsD/CapB family tyrosine-protein kinase [Thiohalocapsa sp.]